VFSANGALLSPARGIAPGALRIKKGVSAERACHERHESRLQRSSLTSTQSPGTMPRLPLRPALLTLKTYSTSCIERNPRFNRFSGLFATAKTTPAGYE